MPPELPEDPAVKEDSLFGRAPILSPIESLKKNESTRHGGEEIKTEVTGDEKQTEKSEEAVKKEPNDPLRDNSHDPLKDPSQLFAFVTKTPSPEKNKGF